jgi:hypothetical protein
MMEIKGTAVKSISDFVKEKFYNYYDDWLNSLPEESKKIMSNPVLPNEWFPLIEAAIIPTNKLHPLIFTDEFEGARQSGRYSAEIALMGIYKFFVKMATPNFVIGKASRIMSTYYRPSELEIVESSSKHAIMSLSHFPESHPCIEYRIAGWCERALEISGCKEVTVTISKSLSNGDPLTEFLIKWS